MSQRRIWAPNANHMALSLPSGPRAMQHDGEPGWWSLDLDEASAQADYTFLIDDDTSPYPDPRSFWQPSGVDGPSRPYDHTRFQWHDEGWQAKPLSEAVLYELHIGTFSPEGTFDSAVAHLDHLVDLGITHVEVMPIADFAGRHGWGYDGVSLFAVKEGYGGPDGFKRFVAACHQRNLAVLLDVVYNHFGPVGNYAPKFAPYLTERYTTPWGGAVNLDGPSSDEVRRYFIDNALMWLRDYHCDGLRLDAVHEYIDRSAINFMEHLAAEVDDLEARLHRPLVLIAESDLNDPRVVTPRREGGFGLDAQWSDDFHHALFAVLYEKEPDSGYYVDFGGLNRLAKAMRDVFVYDGTFSKYRDRAQGRPVGDLPAHHFLGYLQNHDQVGNRALGERIGQLVDIDTVKVGLGLVLTAPFVPMLFMGEEFAASTPFLYFADHEDEAMARSVSEGRKREFAAFGFGEADVPDPEARETFERSRLNWSEVHQGEHADVLAWTKALIALRRTVPSLRDGDRSHLTVTCDADRRTLLIRRGSVRIAVNLAHSGSETYRVTLEPGEQLRMVSRAGIVAQETLLELPPGTLAVLCPNTN